MTATATPAAAAPALITTDQLRRLCPQAHADAWAPELDKQARAYGIITPRRIAYWLGMMCEETGGFTAFSEITDYSAQRLVQVWPSFFPTLASAQPYAHQLAKLANHVYAGRYGNGNEASGDGYRFRGTGPMQLTFESAFAAAEHALNRPYVAHPELLLLPPDGALVAAWFWSVYKGCNHAADADDIDTVTRDLAGSLGNLALRQQWVAKAKAVFGA